MKPFYTNDGVKLEVGMGVWIYPYDGIVGGSIGQEIVGSISEDGKKILYLNAYPEGYIGCRVNGVFFTEEAVKNARKKDQVAEFEESFQRKST